MKNVILILLGAFGLFLAIYYYLQFDKTQQQLVLANQRVLDRDTEIYRLQKKMGTFRTDPLSPKKAPIVDTVIVPKSSTLGELSASEINQLKKQGLKNPETDLKADLKTQQKQILIQKGTMGGTMALRDVKVLNGRYAMAYFEDGHNGGYMVLRYQVTPGGRINWTVLDNYMI